MKKIIFTLNIDNYAPEILEITRPTLEYYANKIGAEIYDIKERKYPEYPVTYEKLQIYELAKKLKADWIIYIDSDALIHPETIDFTNFLSRDTVMHNGFDMANIRWKYDDIFLRDGRNIGSCNWFTIASSWCIDLWTPLDITLEEALNNIFPTPTETNTVVDRKHLIDDYALSRNIAKFGLKFTTSTEIYEKLKLEGSIFLYHEYLISIDEKVKRLKEIKNNWIINAGKIINKK